MDRPNYTRLGAIAVVIAAVTIIAFILIPVGARAREKERRIDEGKANKAILHRELTGATAEPPAMAPTP